MDDRFGCRWGIDIYQIIVVVHISCSWSGEWGWLAEERLTMSQETRVSGVQERGVYNTRRFRKNSGVMVLFHVSISSRFSRIIEIELCSLSTLSSSSSSGKML